MNTQKTLKAPISLSGIGLHSGSRVRVRLLPAAANTGIVFRRMDVEPAKSMVPARFDAVVDTRLGTTIRNAHGVTVSTIEHLMAALWGAGVDNALIELDAPEVPIMDGSSEPFSALLGEAALVSLSEKRRVIRVLKKLAVREGDSFAQVSPNVEGDEGMVIDIEVNYDNAVIGRQSAVFDFREKSFSDMVAAARTFGFAYEVEAMQKAGLALGGSLDNAIVVGENAVLNPEGLRSADEFVRHKALDCVGDLFLAGLRFDACFTFMRPGHGINNSILRALMADKTAYEIKDAESLPLAVPAVSQLVANSRL